MRKSQFVAVEIARPGDVPDRNGHLADRLDSQACHGSGLAPQSSRHTKSPRAGRTAARSRRVATRGFMPLRRAIPIFLLAAFAVYFPALRGEMIWDDADIYLRDNPLLAAPDGWWRFWLTADAPDYYPLAYT